MGGCGVQGYGSGIECRVAGVKGWSLGVVEV